MKQRVIRIIAVVVIVISCFMMGFSTGFIVEKFPDFINKIQNLKNYTRTADFLMKVDTPLSETDSDKDVLFKPFWEAWDLIHYYYVDQPLDENKMMEGAIRECWSH